jgi:pimeloyl-ACP methyl ester carboxylesterase
VTFDEWKVSGRRFAYRRHSIFYQRGGRGDGAPLLLVHGFPTASWDWHRVWDDLCARHSIVIAPDMTGFGWSDKPKGYAYSIHDQAAMHEALLRDQRVDACHVLAHDYGDTVTQELLARGTKLLSVTFLNGGLFPETHRPRLIQRVLASPLGFVVARLTNERTFRKSFSAIFGPDTKPTNDDLREMWQLITHDDGPSVFPKLIGYMEERRRFRERWVGALALARVPIRVIDGAADPVSGAHMVARYKELVPSVDAVLLPNIGHYPHLEAPRAVLDAFTAAPIS